MDKCRYFSEPFQAFHQTTLQKERATSFTVSSLLQTAPENKPWPGFPRQGVPALLFTCAHVISSEVSYFRISSISGSELNMCFVCLLAIHASPLANHLAMFLAYLSSGVK